MGCRDLPQQRSPIFLLAERSAPRDVPELLEVAATGALDSARLGGAVGQRCVAGSLGIGLMTVGSRARHRKLENDSGL